MMGHTHALSGAAAWLGVVQVAGLDKPVEVAGGTLLCAAAALIPDLDSVGSMAARSMGGFTKSAAYVIRACSGGHRHGTHSIAGGGAIPGAVAWGDSYFPAMALFPVPLILCVAVGVAVHIAGDMLTKHGCPLLWPFTLRRFWLLPRRARFSTGDGRFGESIVQGLLIAAIVGWVFFRVRAGLPA